MTILRVIIKKINSESNPKNKILSHFEGKRFNPLRSFWEKVKFFESFSRKCSNLLSHMKRFKRPEFLEWVILVKKGSILRFFKKKSSILRVIRRFCCWNHIIFVGFNSLSLFVKRVQFFESCWKKASILWVMLKSVRVLWGQKSEKFNPLYHIPKIQSFLWVISDKKFNLVGHIFQKVQFLRVTLEKNRFFESFGEKDVQFYVVKYSRKRDVQFCASNWKRGSNSLENKYTIHWVSLKNGSILRVMKKKIQFFEW